MRHTIGSRSISRTLRVFVAGAVAATICGTLGRGNLAATDKTGPADQAQVLLQPGVVPQPGMKAYATDNCMYRFDGAYWQPEPHCRQFPDPRTDQIFDVYERNTGVILARIDLSEPGWYKERKATGPAANLWFKVPMQDLLTHGMVGPNNTYVFLNGSWIKQRDLQEANEIARQRQLMARMTPEEARNYAALLARAAEVQDSFTKYLLGYRRVWKN